MVVTVEGEIRSVEAEHSHSAEVTRFTGYICREVCFSGSGWPDKSGGAWDRETLADLVCLGEKAPVWG